MARSVGLEPVEQLSRSGQHCLVCEAPNGNRATFRMRAGNAGHGDYNEAIGQMRRFFRRNQNPSDNPEPVDVKPANTPAVPAAVEVSRPTITTKKAQAELSAADRELNPREYFKLCEWLRGCVLDTFPSLQAVSVNATKHMGMPISEDVLANALEDTGIVRPEAWDVLPDAKIIILRELETLFTNLGHKPSRHFERLLATLE